MNDLEEKTEFKFSELSDKAKDAARDAHRFDDVDNGTDWWDNTYEDAVRMGALIGINISSTAHVSTKGRNYSTLDISFSGFSSQGDGASFEGNYRHVPDALLKVQEECNDAELIRIASELTVMQLTRRLHGFEPFWASISTHGRGVHSSTIDVTVEFQEDDEHPIDAITDDVIQLMRDFADWIYKQLEAEHDYFTSDEYVNERLNEDDTLFDEDGATI